jgi:hypothetical protein
MRYYLIFLSLLLFILSGLPAEENVTWAPTASGLDGELDFDWIRLTNGEWLKGDFITLRDEKLTFDSDEFGEHTLDMEDIQELYTMSPVTLVYLNRVTDVSRIALIGDDVYLLDSGDDVSRYTILSIVPAEATWWGLWEGKFSLSLAAQYGNTNQTDLQIRGDLVNRGVFNRYSLSYTGSISLVDEIETANSHRLSGIWDRFVSDRFYISPLSYEFYLNTYQNIQQQHTPSIGLGYEIIKGKYFDMDVNGGAGYQMVGYVSVPVGQAEYDHSVVVILGTVMELEPNSDIDFKLDYTIQFDVTTLGNLIQKTLAEFSIDLTGSLDFNIGALWDYRNQPQPREDGSIPEKHDLNITSGIGFEF